MRRKRRRKKKKSSAKPVEKRSVAPNIQVGPARWAASGGAVARARTAGRPIFSVSLPTTQKKSRMPQKATSSSNVNGTARAGVGEGGVSDPRAIVERPSESTNRGKSSFGAAESASRGGGGDAVTPGEDAPCASPPPEAARRSRPRTIAAVRGGSRAKRWAFRRRRGAQENHERRSDAATVSFSADTDFIKPWVFRRAIFSRVLDRRCARTRDAARGARGFLSIA